MATLEERTYTGDEHDYACIVVRAGSLVSRVRITGHDSENCTIPVGAVIAVRNSSII